MASPKIKNIMNSEAIDRSITRLAHEILERNHGANELMLIGILSRGEPLAKRLQALIQKISGKKTHNIKIDGATLSENRLLASKVKEQGNFFIYSFDVFSSNKSREKYSEINTIGNSMFIEGGTVICDIITHTFLPTLNHFLFIKRR